jgi:alpha-tubulin suppressor-like RCC1 family protein
VAVVGLGTVRSVAASGENHIRTFSCAIDNGGNGHCWGANRWGQLGALSGDTCQNGGELTCSLTPILMDTSSRFDALDLGAEFGCGRTTEGEILCWGKNDLGQLGDGTTTSRPMPRSIIEAS